MFREFSRRLNELIWAHPILWIPVLCADFLGFLLNQLQKSVSHRIVIWLVSSAHASVLGGAPDRAAERMLELKASLLTVPLLWGTYFAMVYLYTVAFVTTVGLVSEILGGRRPEMESQFSFVRLRRAGMLSVSSKIFGMLIVAMLLLASAVGVIGGDVSPTSIALVVYLLAYLAVMFLIAPSAMRLIVGDKMQVSRNGITASRRFASLALTALLAIGYSCYVASRTFPTQAAARFITDVVASLLAALPYIPLFVFFALVAFDSEGIPVQVNLDDGKYRDSKPELAQNELRQITIEADCSARRND